MERPNTLLAARGLTDHEDRLLSAGQPLAELQQNCGGDMPGPLAIPELHSLVHQARTMGLRIAREFSASDGEGRITGYARISPQSSDEGGGCEILIENWRREPASAEDDREVALRQDAIDRATAEFSARLDSGQRLLTGEGRADDLADLLIRTRQNSGRFWTDYVNLKGVTHHQPVHWRILDGARCTIDGSERDWFARLLPIGNDAIAPRGFELLLVALQPSPQKVAPGDSAGSTRLVGDELAPALREPVSRIVTNANKISSRLAGPLRQEYTEYASDIMSAGQHLASLLDDLHELESIESTGFHVTIDALRLHELVGQAVAMLQAKAQAKSIEIVADDGGVDLRGFGDAKRVLQILLNLIGNAINYSPEGSSIAIAFTPGNEYSSITISDEGPGLSAAQQERVFAKFERLGRSGDGGSGLGLFISRKLADAMHGELSVASDVGKGAQFTLSLPAEKPARSAQATS